MEEKEKKKDTTGKLVSRDDDLAIDILMDDGTVD